MLAKQMFYCLSGYFGDGGLVNYLSDLKLEPDPPVLSLLAS
jgi:hypothetical protein